MGKLFEVTLLILGMVVSQQMVLATDISSELSSDPHIRRKRMDPVTPAPPGSSPSHQLPPLLAYDLRAVNIIAPTVVVITRNGNIFGTGYAIHPYLVLTASVFARPQYVTGVSTRNRFGEGHFAQRIQFIHPMVNTEYVMIQLRDPIFLDEPVHGALQAARIPESVTNLAYRTAMQWIPGQLIHLRPILRQNLDVVLMNTPTRVMITSTDRPVPGNGYAVHPYIVITRPEFIGRSASVISLAEPTRDPIPHRIQFRYPNRALNVEVLELLDPILLSNGVAAALATEHYSVAAVTWAFNRVGEWKRTRLLQPNFYQQNAA